MKELLATSAAILAAALSFANVIATNRFMRRSQDTQWRRESLQATMKSFLSTIDDIKYYGQYAECALLLDKRMLAKFISDAESKYTDAFQKLLDLHRDAKETIIEFELITAPMCASSAKRLLAVHREILEYIIAPDPDQESGLHLRYEDRLTKSRTNFLLACRAELGTQKLRWRSVKLSPAWKGDEHSVDTH